jgi:hypothetical protein
VAWLQIDKVSLLLAKVSLAVMAAREFSNDERE